MASNRLKIRVIPKFMAAIFAGNGTAVRKNGLATYVDLNYSLLTELTSGLDSANDLVAIYNKSTGIWNTTTLATILSASQSTVIKTGAGDVNVAVSDGLIVINKTVGGATIVNLPASSSKIGPVKIVDWKGDAGTNNITIALTGADKLNGNSATWTIAADGGSVVCTPIAGGTGYAV